MSWFYRPYVPVAERKRKAAKKIASMLKKGEPVEPVSAATPRGKIALSFWGQAWCHHLESYSDFSNRLPRGRTYLRNGSVLHLGIEAGRVSALVMGSELYKQTIRIDPLPKPKWQALKKRCQGKIGSLVELLQGKISDEIMTVVTDRKDGLFPGPKEIKLDCSCPDWAGLCKHLAAILYGVGARLDDSPELLFKLRGVDHGELVQADAVALVGQGGKGSRRRTLSPAALDDVFGIELEDGETDAPPTPPVAKTPRKTAKKIPLKKRVPARRTGRKSKAATAKKTARRLTPEERDARRREEILREIERITAAKKKPRKKKTTRKKTPPAGVPSAPFQPTAAAVRRLRKDLGLTRPTFAARLGVSAQTVANWEGKQGRLNLHARGLSALRALHRKTRET